MIPVGKKLLLVDDNQEIKSIYATMFKGEGFDVTSASDGQEAWELIQQGYIPEVVVTGILMPRMTGFDLINKMQADSKIASVPVAIVSHRGRQEDKVTARQLNVDDFIVQGTTPLVEIIRRVKLLIGIHPTYTVQLVRGEHDTEALVELLDKQQQTLIGSERHRSFFLELEPVAEKGDFKVNLISK